MTIQFRNMINSIVIGLIETAVIIFCIKLFYRIEASYKKNRSQSSFLWLMVLIAQTTVVYILSFIRLILLSLPYDLHFLTGNVYLIITITHTLFIFSFPAFLHSILGLSKKRNIPFLVFLILNVLHMLSYSQIFMSNSKSVLMINDIFSVFINVIYFIFITYLLLIIFITRKNRLEKKISFLTSGILAFHIIYLIYTGFIFNWESFKSELSIYSVIFWVSLPRDLYMLIVFYILFYNLKKDMYELTEREKEILDLLVEKNRSKEIAHKLNISLSTVNSHIYKIYKKKGVSSRRQLLEQL